MIIKKSEDKIIYCYCCRKKTLFIRRDLHNNSGVESHCSECTYVWFEWQNRAVEREKEKWLEYNGGEVNNLEGHYQYLNNNSLFKYLFFCFPPLLTSKL